MNEVLDDLEETRGLLGGKQTERQIVADQDRDASERGYESRETSFGARDGEIVE